MLFYIYFLYFNSLKKIKYKKIIIIINFNIFFWGQRTSKRFPMSVLKVEKGVSKGSPNESKGDQMVSFGHYSKWEKPKTTPPRGPYSMASLLQCRNNKDRTSRKRPNLKVQWPICPIHLSYTQPIYPKLANGFGSSTESY